MFVEQIETPDSAELTPQAEMPGERRVFASIDTAIEDLRAGRMIVVVDDEDRENEGDLTMAAEMVTPEAINFMATHGRGLICLAMTAERADELALGPMTPYNTSPGGTAFTVSIDAVVRGVTTGISARDRAQTILTAIDSHTLPEDLGRPRSSCGTASLGRYLRNHERRWQHGARARPRALLPEAQSQDDYCRGPGALPI
jgi:hypothetical protein